VLVSVSGNDSIAITSDPCRTMQRFLLSTAAFSLVAATAAAQCYEQNIGVLCPFSTGQAGYGDDELFDLQPLNFSFPMGGLATSYTHAHVCTNGVIYLTNGSATNGSTYAYQPTTYFLGAAGQDPRIAPFWIDLESAPQFNGGVYINNTLPGRCVVTWLNVVEWQTQGPTFTIQAQLFANGDVFFFYSPSVYGMSVGFAPQFVARCGISEGNGVAATPVDLSAGNVNLTNFALFEEFPVNVFDLQSRTLQFLYAGTGYVQSSGPCNPAFHDTYGSGCYDFSDSFYQYLADAAGAPAFNGQSMTLTPAGSSYLFTWGGGTYAAPPATASQLTLTDDGETSVTPSIPFPTAAGPVATLFVAANGIVSMAANPDAGNYLPDAQTFLDCAVTAFWSWHDFNPQEPNSGFVKFHEATVAGATIAYITWDGVENYPGGGVLNPTTLQFQLNLSTGGVTWVWQTMDGNIASQFGSGHLFGYSPGGLSTDPGSLTLATTAPFVTLPTNTAAPLLTAAPPPVSSATAGATVAYTTANLLPSTPSGPVYIGLHIVSLVQVPGGLDLTFLGAPGCSAYVGGLDFVQAMVGATSTQSVNVTLPPLLPSGTQLYSQSICLVTPNSLPNGQNAFGMVVSNGCRSYISSF
jgi:hypothetical protein